MAFSASLRACLSISTYMSGRVSVISRAVLLRCSVTACDAAVNKQMNNPAAYYSLHQNITNLQHVPMNMANFGTNQQSRLLQYCLVSAWIFDSH